MIVISVTKKQHLLNTLRISLSLGRKKDICYKYTHWAKCLGFFLVFFFFTNNSEL